jgi:hypothetical protein
MNKLALSAAVVATTAAVAGAAVTPAAGDTKVHTKRLVSTDIASHGLGPHTFAGAAVDRHAGNIVGYDTFTGHFYPKQDRADIWDSIALRGGTISVIVHATASASVFNGRILNGTGKYQGIRGTVTARPAPQNGEKTYITLTYHF